MPSVGAVFAVTLTVRFAVDVPPFESVTVSTTVLAPGVALQAAATVAVMVPFVFVMPLTVIPTATVDAVTVKLPGGWSGSLTVAIVLTVPALPCCLVSGPPGVMAGGVLTVSVKVLVAAAAQLSVAVTVTV